MPLVGPTCPVNPPFRNRTTAGTELKHGSLDYHILGSASIHVANEKFGDRQDPKEKLIFFSCIQSQEVDSSSVGTDSRREETKFQSFF